MPPEKRPRTARPPTPSDKSDRFVYANGLLSKSVVSSARDGRFLKKSRLVQTKPLVMGGLGEPSPTAKSHLLFFLCAGAVLRALCPSKTRAIRSRSQFLCAGCGKKIARCAVRDRGFGLLGSPPSPSRRTLENCGQLLCAGCGDHASRLRHSRTICSFWGAMTDKHNAFERDISKTQTSATSWPSRAGPGRAEPSRAEPSRAGPGRWAVRRARLAPVLPVLSPV